MRSALFGALAASQWWRLKYPLMADSFRELSVGGAHVRFGEDGRPEFRTDQRQLWAVLDRHDAPPTPRRLHYMEIHLYFV